MGSHVRLLWVSYIFEGFAQVQKTHNPCFEPMKTLTLLSQDES